MMKTIFKINLSVFLFVMDIIYSSLIYTLLKYLGVDIINFDDNMKIICLILIDFSFMVIMYLIYHKKINRDIKDYGRNFRSYFSIGIKYWLIGLILMICSNAFISVIYSNQSVNEEVVQSILNRYPIYMIFSASIFAPFVEELIFRKSIRDIFDDKYDVLYIIVSGAVFGFIHTLANISNLMELLYIVPYGIVGSMFAYIYTKTNNILVPMTFHFIHNTMIITISLLSFGV